MSSNMGEGETGETQPLKTSSHKDFVRTSDLLQPGNNPTLTLKERAFIRILTRGLKIHPSANPKEVEIQGLTPNAKRLLDEMVISYFDTGKKPFHVLVDSFRTESRASIPFIPCNLFSLEPGRMLSAGIKGDMNSVVERVSKKEGNCFEFALVMQLIAQTYYPNEVERVAMLGYSDEKNLLGEKKGLKTRHYATYIRMRDENSEKPEHFLAKYGGRIRAVSLEDANNKKQEGARKNELSVETIYGGFLQLAKD